MGRCSLVNASASEDSSSSKYNGNTHINSQISAQGGSVNINSASDLKVVGANILANDIKLDVAGKTTIESAVDTYTSSSKGSGWSAGLGISFKSPEAKKPGDATAGEGTHPKSPGSSISGSISGGFSKSAGNSSIASVGSQTSIIGTNSVSGKTNSLHINGGILGNINNGIDKGNMHLTAEKLTYANIQEHNTSSSSSMGLNISTNVGKGAGSTLANSKGSMQATNQGSDSKGATLATLGGGTITTTNGRDAIKTAENTGPAVVVSGTSNTAGETETTLTDNGINRDIDSTQVAGNTITTGALDIDITVDIASIVNAIDNGKDIAKFVGKGANYVISGIENITKENAQQIAKQTQKIDELIVLTGGLPSIEQQLDMQGIKDPEERAIVMAQMIPVGYNAEEVDSINSDFLNNMIKLPIFKDGIIHRGSDGFGSGLNEVPRGEGVHLGEDFVKELGATVYAPVSGVIKHRNPYEIKSGDKDPIKGVSIQVGDIDIVMFYVEPTELLRTNDGKFNTGTPVNKGDILGTVQDIADHHNKKSPHRQYGMQVHMHMQINVLSKGNAGKGSISPSSYFGLTNVPAKDKFYPNPYYKENK